MKRHRYRRKIAGYSYSPRESLVRKQSQAYFRILLIATAIIAISIFLFKYLDDLIEKITSVGNTFNREEELTQQEPLQLAQEGLLWTPQIDPLSAITNQKKIMITGKIYQGIQAELFFNGESISIDDVDENKKFEFTDLNLKTGENTIAVRAIKEDGGKSELSKEVKVVLDQKPPELTISSPTNGEVFGSSNQKIKVSGNTDYDSKLYVNDHIVIVKDDGTFEYQITLKEGENVIKVKAIDPANNETVTEIKVTFDPSQTTPEI